MSDDALAWNAFDVANDVLMAAEFPHDSAWFNFFPRRVVPIWIEAYWAYRRLAAGTGTEDDCPDVLAWFRHQLQDKVNFDANTAEAQAATAKINEHVDRWKYEARENQASRIFEFRCWEQHDPPPQEEIDRLQLPPEQVEVIEEWKRRRAAQRRTE